MGDIIKMTNSKNPKINPISVCVAPFFAASTGKNGAITENDTDKLMFMRAMDTAVHFCVEVHLSSSGLSPVVSGGGIKLSSDSEDAVGSGIPSLILNALP